MKFKLWIFSVLFGTALYGQGVSIDEVGKLTCTQMVNLLLESSCVSVSNVSVSSNRSVARFNAGTSNFPIQEGITIRNGLAKYSEGPYSGTNLDSQINTNTDSGLQQVANSLGGITPITDVAFLEFDFVPIFNKLEFDFLFASNEYGEWQCGFSDVFVFLLTDLNTNITTNLAVLPNTDTPVSVTTIRDAAHNSSCTSQNPQLFAQYNVENRDSQINMRGYTERMRASSPVSPGTSYRIRLAIGDAKDSKYDSAVFLAAGSFSTAIDLGEDTDICAGDTITVDTGLDAATFIHSWTKNGIPLPGSVGATLSIYESGTYEARIQRNGTSCEIIDEIIVSSLQVNNPEDLRVCYDGSVTYVYNLEENNVSYLGLDRAKYDVYYYTTLPPVNVTTSMALTHSNKIAYESSGNETIYIKVFNKSTSLFCNAIYSFELLVSEDLEVGRPEDILLCDNHTVYTLNLNNLDAKILGELPTNKYAITYYESKANEQNDIPIINPLRYLFSKGTNERTIWARVAPLVFPDCYALVGFDVIHTKLPAVDTLSDIMFCGTYPLPELVNGNYYTESGGPDGGGVLLPAGYELEDSGIYYIYSGPNLQGCSNESRFNAYNMEDYFIPEDYCEEFIVPIVPVGAFYAARGGSLGEGENIPSGTVLLKDQTIYYYAEYDGVFCTERRFDLRIRKLPSVDIIEGVVLCQGDTFILPPLFNSNTAYFIKGKKMEAGDAINLSVKIDIQADDGFCTNQSSFSVSFVPNVSDIVSCGIYVLPDLLVGNYYTLPLGNGNLIFKGTEITESRTLYVYSDLASCTNNLSFYITIKPVPEIEEREDVLLCYGETFVLPPLNYGTYYTESLGTGEVLSAGEIIRTTQVIYIYGIIDGCASQTFFQVEIRSSPQIDNLPDAYICEPYVLLKLVNGNYFTQSGGKGDNLQAGTIISSSQTIYIYKEWEDINGCSSESVFTIHYLGIDLEDVQDVFACDSYILPSLKVGNYYTEPYGQGELIDEGTSIEDTKLFYVYKEESDGRNSCYSQKELTVYISKTPVLRTFEDVESCVGYNLPNLNFMEAQLDTDVYDIGYYWKPNGEDRIDFSQYTFNASGNYTIYVKVKAKENKNCIDETQFSITIFPMLDLFMEEGFLCVDPATGVVENPLRLSTGLKSNEYKVFWYLNGDLVGSGVDYDAKVEGLYTIEAIKIIPDVIPDCGYKLFTVRVRTIQTIAKAYVNEDFSDNSIIRVEIIEGYGTYLYQLDDRGFQNSNSFVNIVSGEHLIKVQDIGYHCAPIFLKVTVLKYPKFFTPNRDGHNDIWNILDLYDVKYEALISIRDRYGKLIRQIYPYREGWDGTFNGVDLPSSDYWFVIDYINEEGISKQFHSHFTLKR